jgi:hypothetical protein
MAKKFAYLHLANIRIKFILAIKNENNYLIIADVSNTI